MPEPYWPKRKGAYTLADAEKNSKYARISCRYCKLERWFLISDLRRLFGDIECDDVIDNRRLRCTGCGGKHSLEMRTENPSAEELQSITIRRLDRIDYVQRVKWKDEKA